MRALVWMLSVMMPIWAPVRLIALCPSEWMAIAIKATLTCSPVERSMSISRAGGSSVICLAKSTSTSVFLPMALTTITTWLPSFWARMAFRAAASIFLLSATLVPPNFWTIIDIGAFGAYLQSKLLFSGRRNVGHGGICKADVPSAAKL